MRLKMVILLSSLRILSVRRISFRVDPLDDSGMTTDSIELRHAANLSIEPHLKDNVRQIDAVPALINKFLFDERVFNSHNVRLGAKGILLENLLATKVSMDAGTQGPQEVKLVGGEAYGLLNEQTRALRYEGIDGIVEICFGGSVRGLGQKIPCQLLYIRGIAVDGGTDPLCQIFWKYLAVPLETVDNETYPFFNRYAIQIHHLTKLVEGHPLALEEFCHQVLLAAKQTVGHMLLVLPYASHALLDVQRIG